MSAHVFLNLLNELRKRDTIWRLPAILSLFATSLINPIIQSMNLRYHLSYDINYSKISFLHKRYNHFVIMYGTLLWTTYIYKFSRKYISH